MLSGVVSALWCCSLQSKMQSNIQFSKDGLDLFHNPYCMQNKLNSGFAGLEIKSPFEFNKTTGLTRLDRASRSVWQRAREVEGMAEGCIAESSDGSYALLTHQKPSTSATQNRVRKSSPPAPNPPAPSQAVKPEWAPCSRAERQEQVARPCWRQLTLKLRRLCAHPIMCTMQSA